MLAYLVLASAAAASAHDAIEISTVLRSRYQEGRLLRAWVVEGGVLQNSIIPLTAH
jgi:hypothetical protein